MTSALCITVKKTLGRGLVLYTLAEELFRGDSDRPKLMENVVKMSMEILPVLSR